MAYIKHKLGKTHYTKKGKKSSRAPLIWCHGGPGGSHQPDSRFFELARNRQVYLYTQIGGGKSSPLTKNQMKIETFVWELKTLIKSWKLDHFYLAGNSWGATLALEYFLRTRDKRIRGLIFQSPLICAKIWQKDAQRLISKMSKKDQKIIRFCQEINATDAHVYQQSMNRFYLKHVLRDQGLLDSLFGRTDPNGDQVYQTMWGNSEFHPTGPLKKYSRIKDLEKIDCPNLWIAGQFDESTPKSLKGYAKRIRNSEVKIIKGGSHCLILEEPKTLLNTVDRFTTRHDK